MIGIIIALLASGLLLYLFNKNGIFTLGFLPVGTRFQQFLIGFFITALLCIGVQYLEAFLQSSCWVLANNVTITVIVQSSFEDIKAVFTEELVFRGALLYILIQEIGSKKGILISAIGFGIYHWFSYGILGNLIGMIVVFIGTGLMGFAWALAFTKTKSIMLPFGLHLGWNFTHNTIFSKGPLGEILLISQGGNQLGEWASLLNFLNELIIVPLIVLACVHLIEWKDKSLPDEN